MTPEPHLDIQLRAYARAYEETEYQYALAHVDMLLALDATKHSPDDYDLRTAYHEALARTETCGDRTGHALDIYIFQIKEHARESVR